VLPDYPFLAADFGGPLQVLAGQLGAQARSQGEQLAALQLTPRWNELVRSLATTMSLFSAQMCTSPQNIYVGADIGVWHSAVGGGFLGGEGGEIVAGDRWTLRMGAAATK